MLRNKRDKNPAKKHGNIPQITVITRKRTAARTA